MLKISVMKVLITMIIKCQKKNSMRCHAHQHSNNRCGISLCTLSYPLGILCILMLLLVLGIRVMLVLGIRIRPELLILPAIM